MNEYKRYGRWIPVIAAIFMMSFVSVYEYSWSLFTTPLSHVFHVPASSTYLGLTYTIFIVVQALSMWLAGRYVDKHRPRNISMIAGVITGIGYILSGIATSLPILYITYGIGSIGVGIIYATSVSTALKWFPDKRGTVSGLIVLGYGAGSFALSPLINSIIHTVNYQSAFIDMGIAQLIIITLLALVMVYPPDGWMPTGWDPKKAEEKRRLVKRNTYNFTTKEMVRTWQWVVIYISFILIAGAGLSIVGHLVPYGESLGLSIAAVIAVYLFPLANGLGRLVAGSTSDFIGRPYSMLLFFVISGISMILVSFVHSTDLFIILIILVAFTWGPLFSLFPSTVGDYFGAKNSGQNYGFTYTAKAIGGIFAGYGASFLFTAIGLSSTLIITGIMAILAGLLAVTLKLPKTPSNAPSNTTN